MTNKKSLVLTEALIWLIVGAFVLLVLFFLIPNLLGKGGKETSNLIDSTGDYDNDGISNFFDKCDCEPGEDYNDGCPEGDNWPLSGEDAREREDTCKKKINGE